jgi:hypothetical protein
MTKIIRKPSPEMTPYEHYKILVAEELYFNVLGMVALVLLLLNFIFITNSNEHITTVAGIVVAIISFTLAATFRRKSKFILCNINCLQGTH